MNTIARRYAAWQVPRYTSYPTAAEFTDAIGVRDHLRWLGALDGSDAVSVYLHVPYCRDICFYCGCHSKMARRGDVIAGYRDALAREIGMVGQALTAPVRVARLHWGGGTPSTLGGDGLQAIVDALRGHFTLEPGFDHAIELDPRYVTDALARRLAELAVTRVSLGVQDVNPLVQAAIGRIQPVRTVTAAVDRLRAVGISQFNFDLMYGLPLQTVDSLRTTCDVVAALSPDRIACYGYAHMPRRKASQRRIDPAALPGMSERFDQAAAITEALEAHGYQRIGLDHYARPDDPLVRAAAAGTLRRNFQGYTDDDRDTLIGFGASAISQLDGGYAQNVADVPAYIRAVHRGRLPTARGCRLSRQDRLRARIIESLLCRFRVDLDEIAPDMDFGDELSLLQSFVADGLVSVRGRVIMLHDQGRPVVRVIASAFDTYSRHRIGRFSVAV